MPIDSRLRKAKQAAGDLKDRARSEYLAWWKQFSTDDLERIRAGDEAAIKRAYALGFEKISKLTGLALTPKEKADLAEIKKELKKCKAA